MLVVWPNQVIMKQVNYQVSKESCLFLQCLFSHKRQAASVCPVAHACRHGDGDRTGQGQGWGYQQRPRIVMTNATPIPGSHVTAVDLSEGSEITPVRSLRPQTLARKRVK